jgi:hypothetical protein
VKPADTLALVEGPEARAILRATGAQVWRPAFRLPDGRWVEPLATAPWGAAGDRSGAPGLPGHLADLGGEFFCLPFGGNAGILDPLPGWEAAEAGGGPDPMHGPAANDPWHLVAATGLMAEAALDLPGMALRRRITAEGTSLLVEVGIRLDAPRRVPVAFHPNLRLPDRPKSLALTARFAEGRSYPGRIGPGVIFAPGARFTDLARVPGLSGPVDLTKLPIGARCDDVVMLFGCEPSIEATYPDEGFRLRLTWDARLPHCMLWLHDRGLDDPPWGGRFRTLGIEPMAAAFDLPEGMSTGDNPLRQDGHATCLDLPAGETRLWLRLAVSTA